MKIISSETAKTSFARILDFLELTWEPQQIRDFYLLTEKVLRQIRKNPYQFKSSDKKETSERNLSIKI